MADDQNFGQGYTGGFSMGNQGSSQTPPTPPTPQPVEQPVQPAPPAPPMSGMGSPTPPPRSAQGAMGGAQQPPFDPNYVFGAGMQNFTTTIKLPSHQLNFDEAKFLNLLAGSISLTRDEKKKIIDSIPKLRQEQVDELMRIFEEERAKFVELSPKHGAQLKKLEDEHLADWKDIELSYKSEAQSKKDESDADDIRKQLGI